MAHAPRLDDTAGAPWWARDAAAFVRDGLKALLGDRSARADPVPGDWPTTAWPDSFFDPDPGRAP